MIHIVGIGPGERELMTQMALERIRQADVLVGWSRALAQFPDFSGEVKTIGCDIPEMLSWLKQNQTRSVVVLASGDPMLFGIGKRICDEFSTSEREVINGISSIQYLFGCIGLDMNDVYITSTHGKTPDFDLMLQHKKVALVTDKTIGPYQIAQALLERGSHHSMIIGENLSYPNEQIHYLHPSKVPSPETQEFNLNVVVLLDERQ